MLVEGCLPPLALMQRARGDKYVWERAEGQVEVQVDPKGPLKHI